MACIKKRDKRTHRRTDNPKPIRPVNFFEIGGITTDLIFFLHFFFCILMHQSFVTGPYGAGDRGQEILECKAWVYARHWWDIFMVEVLPKALLKSWQVNMKLLAGLGMESKAPQFHGTAGTILTSKHGTEAPLCSSYPGPIGPWLQMSLFFCPTVSISG